MRKIKNIGFSAVVMVLSLHAAGLFAQVDTVCFNDTILYQIPGSKGSAYDWSVSGGSVIYSSTDKDSLIVVWNESNGLHALEVTKFNNNNCSGEPERLNVFVYQPRVDLGKDRTFCEGDSEILEADPGYQEYIWNDQPGKNILAVNSSAHIKLEVTDKYGCRASDTISVTEIKNPQPDFTMELDTLNSRVTVHNLSDSSWQYLWNFGDSTSSDIYDPDQHTYKGPGTYEITLKASTNSCSGTVTKKVSTLEALQSDFVADYAGCAPLDVRFNNLSTGAGSYYWDFGNGDLSNEESPVTRYDEAGIYEVTLYAVRGKDTSISKTPVLVNEAPVADFDISPAETGILKDVDFSNRSTNAIRYSWDFGDGNTSRSFEPVHSYSSAGIYTISLKVWSAEGCTDSLSINNAVTVGQNCRMLFPTGFMPNKNGPSGGYYDPDQKVDNNEIFHPVSEDLEDYELRIYNRWGVLVFISHDIEKGWDGYYKGKLVPQDTYVYKASARCSSGKKILAMGSVTLIY